jgi:hypothetical protein
LFGKYCKSTSNRDPGSRRRGSLIYTSFCRYGLSEDHIAITPHDINRFRIAALWLDDYAAGLAHDAWAMSLRPVQGLTAIPGPKKMTADASGFCVLTTEGMAGTSQVPPAAETPVMVVAQGSIARAVLRSQALRRSVGVQAVLVHCGHAA